MPVNHPTRALSALALLATSLLTQGACSTSMTNMTEARAYKPGEFQVAVNMQVNAHANVTGGLKNAAESAASRWDASSDEPISEEDYRKWLDAVLLVGLFKPAIGPELIVRGGVTDDVLEGIDAGIKLTPNLLQLSGKLQLWASDKDDRHAVSLMLGYAKHFGLANSIIETLTLTEFSRWDIDARLLYGWNSGDFLKVTMAPHLIVSRVSADHKAPQWLVDRLPEDVRQYDPNQLFDDQWLVLAGVNTGVMLGYKYAFIALDLGLFWLNFKPTVVGEERDYSGGALSLAGGLSFNYKFF